MIHTVDTDVLVIAISLFWRLKASKINKILIKGLFIVKIALSRIQLVYRHSTQILRNKHFKYNMIPGLKYGLYLALAKFSTHLEVMAARKPTGARKGDSYAGY